MAFCSNCGKQLPPGAQFCGACGTSKDGEKPEGGFERSSKKQRKQRPKGHIPGWVSLVVIGLVIAAIWFNMNSPKARSVAGNRTPSYSKPKPAPPAEKPIHLELGNWSFSSAHRYITVKGIVKNISDSKIDGLQAVFFAKDKDGEFITSDTSYIEYQPLLPGQSSPFTVMLRDNPAIKKGSLEFKTLTGGKVRHRNKGGK